MIVIWIAAIVVFGIVEAVTVGLVSIWFVLGAVAGLLAAVLGAALWVQIVLFFVVSIAALAAAPPPAPQKTSRRRNIERIFSIPSRTDNIDRIMTIQIHDHPPFENGFPKPGQFFRRNTTHQKNGHKSRQLAVVIPAVGNVQQDLFSFFFREAFVPEHFI